MTKFKIYLFISFLIISYSIFSQTEQREHIIIESDKIYTLDSQWDFELIDSDTNTINKLSPTGCYQVLTGQPSLVNDASFTMTFTSNLNRNNLAIFLPFSYGGSKLIVNKKEIISANQNFGSYPQLIDISNYYLNNQVNEINLVAKTFSAWAGFGGFIEIGTFEKINEKWIRFILKNAAISFVSLFLAVYFLIMYLFRKKEKYNLIFAGFSFSVSLFVLGYYGLSLYLVNQAWAYWVLTFVGGINMYLMPILFLHSFYEIKPKLGAKIFTGFYIFLTLFVIIEFIVTGQLSYFNKYLYIGFNLSYIIVVIYLFVFSIKAVRKKLEHSRLMFIGTALLTLSFVYSMLTFTLIIKKQALIGEGFFLMVLVFAAVLAKRFAQTHTELELAYGVNIELNKSLENKVLERTKELAAKNKEIIESIEYAALIQNSMLPGHEQMEDIFSDFYISWRPKDIVGGDFYWLHETPNGFIIAVVDCTGHGVPGALLTMTAKSSLDRVVTHINADNPGSVVGFLNKLLKKILSQENPYDIKDDGLDIGLCIYNRDENVLKFSGSKIRLHIMDGNSIQEFTADRQGVGYKRTKMDYQFKTNTINIKPGMTFHLTTDGYLEQNGGDKGFSFGWTNYRNALEKGLGKTMNEQLSILEDSLAEFQGDSPQRDDITLLGFKIKESE